MNLACVALAFAVCFVTRCWILDESRVTEIDEASADTLQSWFIGDFGADTLWVSQSGRIVHAMNGETGEQATIDRMLVRVTRHGAEGSKAPLRPRSRRDPAPPRPRRLRRSTRARYGDWYGAGSRTPAAANPASLRRQESHSPQAAPDSPGS